MSNRWAMSGLAIRFLETRHVVGVVEADTFNQAMSLAVKVTQIAYPESEGWVIRDTSIQNMDDLSPLKNAQRVPSWKWTQRYREKKQ